MTKISIVTPCYNEEANVKEVFSRTKKVMNKLSEKYTYEHIFIDNASTDNTVAILKALAKDDKNLKIIVNSRNFGHTNSPVHGMFQANGDIIILMVADLQDPPEMLLDFIKKYEEGFEVVVAVKKTSKENSIMFLIRKLYYYMLNKLSSRDIIQNFTGFGLYSKKIIDEIKKYDDKQPFFRGMIAEVGFEVAKIEFDQPIRTKGLTKNNLYTLYDVGILGIINNSKNTTKVSCFFWYIIFH